MGEHPFVLEYRVRRSANFQVTETRRWKRFWELHLLLSLLLHGRITRELRSHPHHWMLLREPTADGSQTVYANEGYMIAGFVARADDFTTPSGHRKLAWLADWVTSATDPVPVTTARWPGSGPAVIHTRRCATPSPAVPIGYRQNGSSAISSPIGGRLSGEAGVRISGSFL